MNIAILEDDQQDMDHLQLLLQEYAEKGKLDMMVETFSVSEKFLRAFYVGKYDLIFFDNYIGSGLGIDIARKVRLVDNDVDIVFVSMSAEFAISGFEVGALHYLIKPVAMSELEQVFERRKKKVVSVPKREILIDVTAGQEPVMLPISEIEYIEVLGKTCTIHHDGTKTNTHISLDKMTEQLSAPKFLRTHKSYIVNLDFVKTIGKSSFQMKAGAEIPIGQMYLVSCKQKYMEYLAD